MIRDTGKMLITCLAVVFAVNALLYFYLQWQPLKVSSTPDKTWGYASATLPAWRGIEHLEGPVDNIILGDSGALINLQCGIISDCLGGTTINLGNTGMSGLIMDGWMLKRYIDRFGPPRNVLLLRTNNSWEREHDTRFLAVLPFHWGFWDEFGLVPNWKPNELLDLYISKYLVIYSDADIIRDRLTDPASFFSQPYWSIGVTNEYDRGLRANPALVEAATTDNNSEFFRRIVPSGESSKSLKFMYDLARQYHFQLYILQGPENDAMYQDQRRKDRVAMLQTYLSHFTDNQLIHLVPDAPLTFSKMEMQNPNHLTPEAAGRYSQAIASSIIKIQDRLAQTKEPHPVVTEIIPERTLYLPEETPSVTIVLRNYTDTEIKGTVYCLAKLTDTTDERWAVRSAAVDIKLGNLNRTTVKLLMDKGKMEESGLYDVNLYYRTLSDNLSVTSLLYKYNLRVKGSSWK